MVIVAVADEVERRLDPRLRRIEEKTDRIEAHMEKVPATRKGICALVKRSTVSVVLLDYGRKCPCCRDVHILDHSGSPLPNLEHEHWTGRHRVSATDVWAVCSDCNMMLGEPGNPLRDAHIHKFKVFQEAREARFGKVRVHRLLPDPKQERLF